MEKASFILQVLSYHINNLKRKRIEKRWSRYSLNDVCYCFECSLFQVAYQGRVEVVPHKHASTNTALQEAIINRNIVLNWKKE
jgi:hypothetical protein